MFLGCSRMVTRWLFTAEIKNPWCYALDVVHGADIVLNVLFEIQCGNSYAPNFNTLKLIYKPIMGERWSKTSIYWTFICRQDLWQHSQLKWSPSKTALCAIFQSNDFNDYWDFSALQRIIVIQWGQPWNLQSPCLFDRLLFHPSPRPQNQIWNLILIIWDWLISVS